MFTVYTIGHSTHTLDHFLSLLTLHQITALADTRSIPYSRRMPWFRRDALRQAVEAASIRYVPLGNFVGGRPKDPSLYDARGHVLYPLVRQSAAFLEGIQRIEKGAALFRLAILCAEENPLQCHRHMLITPALLERGAEVLHIRGDGTLQTEEDLTHHANIPQAQPTLFA